MERAFIFLIIFTSIGVPSCILFVSWLYLRWKVVYFKFVIRVMMCFLELIVLLTFASSKKDSESTKSQTNTSSGKVVPLDSNLSQQI